MCLLYTSINSNAFVYHPLGESVVEELLGDRLLVPSELVLLVSLDRVKVAHDDEEDEEGEENPDGRRPVVGSLDGIYQRQDEEKEEHAREDAAQLEVLLDDGHDAEEVKDA